MGDRTKRIISGILRGYVVIFLLMDEGFFLICSVSFTKNDRPLAIDVLPPIVADVGY